MNNKISNFTQNIFMLKNPLFFCLIFFGSISFFSKAIANTSPVFVNGHRQNLILCENSTKLINLQTAVNDPDAGQTEIWTLINPPVNGTAIATYTTTATGAVLIPAGLSYTPVGGFSGIDSFMVAVSDGTDADTTTIYVTVNPNPAAITGNLSVCTGSATTLSDITPGGTWSGPGSTTVLSVNSGTGAVTGNSQGTAFVSYTLSTGCKAIAAVTVNRLPVSISGPLTACTGSATTTLTDVVTGGTWNSGNNAVATIGSVAGDITGVSAGTTDITYTLPTGCLTTATLTVYPTIIGISGATQVCVGFTTALSGTAGAGTWSSGNTAVATVGSASGIVTGKAAGTATITYTLGACGTATTIVTVNPLPAPIIGNPNVCIGGNTTTLSDATTGGTWSSLNGSVATVNPATGVVTSVAFGTAPILYTLGTGCYTSTGVSVSTPPPAISGGGNVCNGLTATLVDAQPGGTWSSSNPGVATITSFNPTTAILTGVSAGTTTITYAPGTGCVTTRVVQTFPLAPITGTPNVCAGLTTALGNAIGGGTWSSSNLFIASVTPGGVVTGYSAGVVNITYSLSTGCKAFQSTTVNPLPAAIMGVNGLCEGATATYSDATPGGTWSCTSGATISSTGVLTGVTAGPATVIYTIGTGCVNTKAISVNALPFPDTLTGGGNYCAGGAGVPVGLNGSTVGINYFLRYGSSAIGPVAGTGAPISFGLQTLAGTYTADAVVTLTGCRNNMTGTDTVTIIPNVIPSVTLSENPGDTICAGTTTIFTALPVNGGTDPSYQWFVNGTNVGIDTFFYTFLPADGDVVTVKLISNAVCPAPDTVADSVAMVVLPAGIPSAGLSIFPNDTICQGTTVTVTPVPLYGGDSPLYYWRKNGVIIATGPSFRLNPADSDVLDAIMVSDYQCRFTDTINSAAITMEVEPFIIPRINIVSNPPALTYPGQSLTLTAEVGTTDSVTYQWVLNHVTIPGATSSSYTCDTLHYYKNDSVTLYITTWGPCHISTFTWTYVTNNVGVKDILTGPANISVFPNPGNGVFTISGSLGVNIDEDVSLTVTNVVGQVVYRSNLIASNGNINEQVSLGSGIAKGTYLLNIRSAGVQKVVHIVVE